MAKFILKPSTKAYDGMNSINDIIGEYKAYLSLLSNKDLLSEYNERRQNFLTCASIMDVRFFESVKQRALEKGLISGNASNGKSLPEM